MEVDQAAIAQNYLNLGWEQRGRDGAAFAACERLFQRLPFNNQVKLKFGQPRKIEHTSAARRFPVNAQNWSGKTSSNLTYHICSGARVAQGTRLTGARWRSLELATDME